MRHSILVLLLLVATGYSRPPDYIPDGPYLPGKPGARFSPSALLADSVHSYDVRHYRLDFELPMYNAGYSCREVVCIRSRVAALDSFSLDFDRLTCDSVRRSGTRLAFTTPPGKLAITLDAPLVRGDSTDIEIFFRRESTTANAGYFYGRPPQTAFAHAMTCGCPTDNHYWFACWDHPMDKSDRGVMMNFTLPDTFQVCSNGRLDSVTTAPGNRRTWWWHHSYPIATYLMTFSASRFASWDTIVRNNGGDSVPIRHWMWPTDSALTRSGYARLPRMMNYFADTALFGPYPFESFGHVPGYYGFPWGGMEHQTLVMLNRNYIGGGADATIAHELSHMWWGDMVTHVGYADVWLNEGFATWAECMYMGHANGRSYFNNYIKGKATSYINGDRSRRFPIYNPPWELIYDYGTIYCKGAWVMHMLRWVTGDTAWQQPGVFFRALRAYGDSFRYGTVSTEDFRRICERETGLELDWFFDEWIYQAGYPKYRLSWIGEPAGDSFRIVTSLAQNNGAQAPDFFRTPLPVRINCLYVDTLVTIRPQANPQVDTFLVHTCPDSITIDPDNWVLDSSYILAGIAEFNNSFSPFATRSSLLVSPNPARGIVTVRLHSSPGDRAQSLAIYNAAGRIVRSAALGPRCEITLDLRPLPAGVYYFGLRDEPTDRLTRLVLSR